VTEPLKLVFTVCCDADHAFALWTERASMWWPAEHTVSRSRPVDVVVEPGVGGRVFERTPSGGEIDWGSVTVWEPPGRLVYRWHLLSDPQDATEVEIRFVEESDGTTRVEIEHRGFEALGDPHPLRQGGNRVRWEGLLSCGLGLLAAPLRRRLRCGPACAGTAQGRRPASAAGEG